MCLLHHLGPGAWSSASSPKSTSSHLTALAIAIICFAAGGCIDEQCGDADGTSVCGLVTDENGPVAGATVRVQLTANSTTTDALGRFTLGDLAAGQAVTISAWKHEYYCAKAENIAPPTTGVVLSLHRYPTGDNPAYEWIPPANTDSSCLSCKSDVTRLFLEDAHAGSAQNPRFLSMHQGTDTQGNQSPPTTYVNTRDYGRIPLPPDRSRPYYGPGYKLDFPNSTGNCAACHIPGAAIDAPYDTDPTQVTGADTFGIHCDFCHKIADARLDPDTGMPFAGRPGVLSMDVRRPFPDEPGQSQIFFGTFDDNNVVEGDTYLPFIEESRFCAPCHFGVFWNVTVYNSFGEWLDSPYSDPLRGKTCQQCHMPAPSVVDGRAVTNVAPGQGALERPPLAIHSHKMPGAMDQTLLQNSVTLSVSGEIADGTATVQVCIVNDRTGHHVPTDSPLRHLILIVQATDESGQPLTQLSGETLPEWCGIGEPADGCYAGLPGKAFAKVLQELWTDVSPTGAYWNQTRLISDNRIAAFATDTSSYAFAAPAQGQVAVEVTLLFRRAFYQLMVEKGWAIPDIVMEQEHLTLSAD